MGARVDNLGTWLLLAAVASLGGCGSRSLPAFTDKFTGDGGTSGGTGSSSTSTSTDSTEPEDTETTDDTDMPPPPDEPVEATCNLYLGEACPADDKCVPIPWACCNKYECVPVLGDKGPGEACTNEGEGSNLDDCGPDSYCFEAECRGFCDELGGCEPGARCLYAQGNALWLCVDQCDPLAQDCPPGEACSWRDESWGFQCDALDGGAGPGEPCFGELFGGGCAAGLGCVGSAEFPGVCAGDSCCSPLCDQLLGDDACVGLPGVTGASSCSALGFEPVPELGVCTGSVFAPGDLQIVEVYANPPGLAINEQPLEFVEILNLSGGARDLNLLAIDDAVGGGSNSIAERFTPIAGDGGCGNGVDSCLAPGERALFVGSSYVGETGGALVFAADNINIFATIFQPFSQVELYDSNLAISGYRFWEDPSGPPLPTEGLSMHRVDPGGADLPENWLEGPPTPGL